MNPEAMGLHVFEDDDLTSDDIVIPSEPCKAFDMDTFLKNSKTDRETNTEYVFVQPSGTPRGSNGLGLGTRPKVKEVVKRCVNYLFFNNGSQCAGVIFTHTKSSEAQTAFPNYYDGKQV